MSLSISEVFDMEGPQDWPITLTAQQCLWTLSRLTATSHDDSCDQYQTPPFRHVASPTPLGTEGGLGVAQEGRQPLLPVRPPTPWKGWSCTSERPRASSGSGSLSSARWAFLWSLPQRACGWCWCPGSGSLAAAAPWVAGRLVLGSPPLFLLGGPGWLCPLRGLPCFVRGVCPCK